ncbi:hypothetical protein CPB84DRAFT_1676233 [Gymnopilus junonius]|uniref:DUF6697 domain-containing protein n=1 Tax=Gymnopilus junonius TaxID=109634 RepID=A0A9P5NQS2_GYMJU|nr:hypothetical protein CPB84DRAFT_1676233 [Gymnopilus junonius]
MDLLADTIRDRLKPIGLDLYDITLDRASQEVWVTREFMSATYGGSMQATCPSIGKKLLARHGLNDFCYLNLDYQPQAPQIPGAPGLFYSTESGGDWKGDQRVLTRVRPNEWQYMGMYAIKTCKSLTKEEWASQPPKVRSTWAKQICLQGWGGWVQARVRARIELEREPTEKEIQNVFDNGSFRATTPDEVAEAYNKGQECLGVWTMKCVGYDNDFQLQLCQKFPNWIPRPRNSRKGKKSDMKPNTGSSQHRNNKRTHPSPASPESEDESFENDESE